MVVLAGLYYPSCPHVNSPEAIKRCYSAGNGPSVAFSDPDPTGLAQLVPATSTQPPYPRLRRSGGRVHVASSPGDPLVGPSGFLVLV